MQDTVHFGRVQQVNNKSEQPSNTENPTRHFAKGQSYISRRSLIRLSPGRTWRMCEYVKTDGSPGKMPARSAVCGLTVGVANSDGARRMPFWDRQTFYFPA